MKLWRVFVHVNHQCSTPVEALYYTLNYQDCCHCGSIERMIKSSNEYPICTPCKVTRTKSCCNESLGRRESINIRSSCILLSYVHPWLCLKNTWLSFQGKIHDILKFLLKYRHFFITSKWIKSDAQKFWEFAYTLPKMGIFCRNNLFWWNSWYSRYNHSFLVNNISKMHICKKLRNN